IIFTGNGPSAISLSYLLDGNRPYYNGNPHPNKYLHEKLQALGGKESILDQNLEFFSEGIEGRSTNPIALLFDSLCRPDADLGIDNPSLLKWVYEKEHSVNHIVLGKGKPGGAWQKMDGSMQTLSFGSWMELPSLSFKEWHAQRHRDDHSGLHSAGRATTKDMRHYYADFVEERHLSPNFRDSHVVTSVQKVAQVNKCIDSESGEVEPCCKCKNVKKNHSYLWEVRGYNIIQDDMTGELCESFCYIAPNVVIATGTSDTPNRLGVPGETLPHCLHSLQELEQTFKNNRLPKSQDPVLIVGAGLSAADAILMALEAKRPVVHVFRCGPNDSSLIFRKLPSTMYPEYHKVHSLMKGKAADSLYKPYPKHHLVDVKEDGGVLLQSPNGGDILSLDVTCVVILIGSKPDLSFLPNEGRNLGIYPQNPVDSKHNPIDIDQYSYESIQEEGLYAMGPLVGDNFVRFGVGGSLGIANHINAKKKKCCG
ncbi:hypothetical protein FSP39_003576, partial [Pinctada imbricata]